MFNINFVTSVTENRPYGKKIRIQPENVFTYKKMSSTARILTADKTKSKIV